MPYRVIFCVFICWGCGDGVITTLHSVKDKQGVLSVSCAIKGTVIETSSQWILGCSKREKIERALPIGKYTLKISAPGYYPLIREVDIKHLAITKLDIELLKAPL